VEDGAFVSVVVLMEGNEGQILRTRIGLWRKLRLHFSILCIFGQLLLFPLW
jgi:hypothetical protein